MSLQIRRSRRWPLTAALLVAATLATAGCGAKDGSAKTTATSAPAATVASGSAGAGAGDATSTASGSAAGTGAQQTLRFESQLSSAPHASSAAPGSAMVFTGMLFAPGGASAIGRSQGSCTRTAPGRGAVFQCLLSFVLRDGAIFAQSFSSMGGPANGAVTGGVGRYGGARGTFSYKANGTPRVDLVMRYAR